MANLNVRIAANKTLDISKTPHTLIAGQTGSGKSVCVNAILSSLISQNSPKELKLILIDPKVVEMMPYSDVPHLLFPVITETPKAVQALNWAVTEMESRYRKLADLGVRNLQGYNDKVSTSDSLASIVIVIDEFADLMYVARKEVETQIIRIAQKARAVGIHLILATQRPSVNVITGILKANIPTRICFQVASQIDARTVMDLSGAEKLMGKGDMLIKENGKNEVSRYQGIFITDTEVENTVNESIEKFDNDSEVKTEKISDMLDKVISQCNERRARITKILAR